MGRSQAKTACDDLSSFKEKFHAIAPEARELLAELHPVGGMVEILGIVDAIPFLENVALNEGESCASTNGQSVIARMERWPGPLLFQSTNDQGQSWQESFNTGLMPLPMAAVVLAGAGSAVPER
jgi:hypothetical protein